MFLFFAGYRHPSPAIVARTVRILHTLLTLVNKHRNCDKFEVNTQSVAYLAGKNTKKTVNRTTSVFEACHTDAGTQGPSAGCSAGEQFTVQTSGGGDNFESFAKTFCRIKEFSLESVMCFLCHLWFKILRGSLLSVIKSGRLSLASWALKQPC